MNIEIKNTINSEFDIQTDYLTNVIRSDLVIRNKEKKNCQTMDVAVSTDHRRKLNGIER